MGAFFPDSVTLEGGVSFHTLMAVNTCREELDLELSVKEVSFCCPASFRSPPLL